MAIHTNAFSPRLPAAFDKLLGTLRIIYAACIDAPSRRNEVERLQNKSDAQLADMGLTRARIVHHVFRDLIG